MAKSGVYLEPNRAAFRVPVHLTKPEIRTSFRSGLHSCTGVRGGKSVSMRLTVLRAVRLALKRRQMSRRTYAWQYPTVVVW